MLVVARLTGAHMIPTFIFQVWLLGLFSFGLIGGGIYLAHEWQQRSWAWDPVRLESVFAPYFGANEETAMLVAAAVLFLIVLAGGSIVKGILRMTSRSKPNDDPRVSPKPPYKMRKRIVNPASTAITEEKGDWLDLEQLAEVEVTSEDANAPIERVFVLRDPTGWRAAKSGEQTIRLLFDSPQNLRLHRGALRRRGSRARSGIRFPLRDGGRPAAGYCAPAVPLQPQRCSERIGNLSPSR